MHKGAPGPRIVPARVIRLLVAAITVLGVIATISVASMQPDLGPQDFRLVTSWTKQSGGAMRSHERQYPVLEKQVDHVLRDQTSRRRRRRLAIRHNDQTSAPSLPRGHMQPFGAHREPSGEVLRLDSWPTAGELFSRYMSSSALDTAHPTERVRKCHPPFGQFVPGALWQNCFVCQ